MPPSHTRTTVDLAVAQKKFLRRVEGYALLALITDVACGTYALAMAERLITTDGSGPAAAAVHAFLLIALLAMPFGLHKAFTTGKVQPPSNKSTTSEWARFAGQLLIGQAVLVMLALILGLAAYAQASAAAGQYSQCMEEYYAAQNALYAQRTDQVPTNGCFKALSGSLELGGRVSRVAQLFVLVHMLLFAGYVIINIRDALVASKNFSDNTNDKNSAQLSYVLTRARSPNGSAPSSLKLQKSSGDLGEATVAPYMSIGSPTRRSAGRQ